MKVLITGADGQLGTDLRNCLPEGDVIPLTHAELDVTDLAVVKKTCQKYRPDVIINTAAFVRVDDCEEQPELAFRVNALGPRNAAVAAQETGAKLVQVSTDYVFGGAETRQVPYTEFDPPAPLGVYGSSKLAGEELVRHLCSRHFIVRTSGLFGTAGSSGKGGNFVETMLRLGRERRELRVVQDQVFSPTGTRDLARKIVQLASTDYYGIFHVTGSGVCSWYDFAREIIRLSGLDARVIPITSAQYPQKARRPAYSVLDHFHLRLLGMDDMPGWQESLKDYLQEKGQRESQGRGGNV